MPKIIDETVYGQTPAPVDRRTVVKGDRSGVILGEGVQSLGQDMMAVGGEMIDRRDKSIFADGRSKFLLADAQARRKAMEDSNDYENWEGNYRENMNKVLSEMSGAFRNNEHKNQFLTEGKLTIERGGNAIFGESFKREIDDNRATVVNNNEALLRELENTALSDHDTRMALIARMNDNINQAQLNGYYTAPEAEKLRMSTSSRAAESYIGMMDYDQQIKILGNTAASSVDGVAGSDTVLAHSQNIIDSGKAQTNPDGSITTFKGSVVTEDWLNDGKPTLIPTFWDGKQYDISTDEGMKAVKEKVEASGKTWPSADTIDEALAMEKTIHDEMEKQGRGGVADLLMPSTRKQMLRTAQNASAEERVMEVINDNASEIVDTSASLSEARKQARSLEGIDSDIDARARARLATEVEQRWKEKEQAEKDAQDELFEGYREMKEKGEWSWNEASGLEQKAIMDNLPPDYIAALKEPASTEHNEDLYLEFLGMDPEEQRAVKLSEYERQLDTAHYHKVRDIVGEMRGWPVGNKSSGKRGPQGTKVNTVNSAVTDRLGGTDLRRTDFGKRYMDRVQIEIDKLEETIGAGQSGYTDWTKIMDVLDAEFIVTYQAIDEGIVGVFPFASGMRSQEMDTLKWEQWSKDKENQEDFRGINLPVSEIPDWALIEIYDGFEAAGNANPNDTEVSYKFLKDYVGLKKLRYPQGEAKSQGSK